MLMLATVVAVQAQSLTGKMWAADMSEPGMPNVHLVLMFEDGGNYTMTVLAEQPIEDKVKLLITFISPGTYKVDGKVLNGKLNGSKAQLDFDIEAPGVDASTLKMMKGMLMSEVGKQKEEMKKSMLEELPKLENMTITTLTESKLVLTEKNGSTVEFAAVKE